MAEDLIYKFDAPREFQPYIEEYEFLVRQNSQATEREGWATGAALIGGLAAVSGIFFPEAGMGAGLGTMGLIAAICGGIWLFSNKHSKTERYRRMWAVETYFREKGYAILYVPGPGVSIYKPEPKP